MFGESLFKKIENKTNINKDTIMALANKLQNGDMKNESTIRDLVKEISSLSGKEVSREKEDKIVNAVLKDNVPKDLGNML